MQVEILTPRFFWPLKHKHLIIFAIYEKFLIPSMVLLEYDATKPQIQVSTAAEFQEFKKMHFPIIFHLYFKQNEISPSILISGSMPSFSQNTFCCIFWCFFFPIIFLIFFIVFFHHFFQFCSFHRLSFCTLCIRASNFSSSFSTAATVSTSVSCFSILQQFNPANYQRCKWYFSKILENPWDFQG